MIDTDRILLRCESLILYLQKENVIDKYDIPKDLKYLIYDPTIDNNNEIDEMWQYLYDSDPLVDDMSNTYLLGETRKKPTIDDFKDE
jgi:hypothetical protein